MDRQNLEDKTDYSKWPEELQSFRAPQEELPFKDYGIFIPTARTPLQRCLDALDLLQMRIHNKVDIWRVTGRYAPYNPNPAPPLTMEEIGRVPDYPDYRIWTFMRRKGVELARPKVVVPQFPEP
jgi:hypothetical protein